MTYDNWQGRIEKYGFVENVDYLLHKIVEQVAQYDEKLRGLTVRPR